MIETPRNGGVDPAAEVLPPNGSAAREPSTQGRSQRKCERCVCAGGAASADCTGRRLGQEVAAVRRPPSPVRRPPPPVAVRRPPSALHRPPSTVHRPPSTVHRPPLTVHRPLRIVFLLQFRSLRTVCSVARGMRRGGGRGDDDWGTITSRVVSG